jgi:hypothetical protein
MIQTRGPERKVPAGRDASEKAWERHLPSFLRNWLRRHRNPVNAALHALGIPATVLAAPLAIRQEWAWAVGLFVSGYAVQFLGHVIEGNRSGEEGFLRRLLGRLRR